MKKISKRTALMLLSIGFFVIATSQIVSRFIALPDLAKGLIVGVGIGLLILSVILSNLKVVQ